MSLISVVSFSADIVLKMAQILESSGFLVSGPQLLSRLLR